MSVKEYLRTFVVWSSASPLRRLYILIYQSIIFASLSAFRCCRGASSIYLARGCAKEQIVPGISDIDFVIITNGSTNGERRLRQVFALIHKVTLGLVEYYPNAVCTEAEFIKRSTAKPAWGSRYIEGKRSWKLLYGVDLLPSVPMLSEAERRNCCFAEMNLWWILFARQLLSSSKNRSNSIIANSTCYKAVSETLLAYENLRDAKCTKSRAEILQGENPTCLTKKCLKVLQSNYLSKDTQLIDDTFHFLLDFFQQNWKGEHSLLPSENLRDAGTLSNQQNLYLDQLRELLSTSNWTDYKSVRIAHGRPLIDGELLIIEMRGGRMPLVQEITAITDLHRSLQGDGNRLFHLYLNFGALLFPVTPRIPEDLHLGVAIKLDFGSDEVSVAEKSPPPSGYC